MSEKEIKIGDVISISWSPLPMMVVTAHRKGGTYRGLVIYHNVYDGYFRKNDWEKGVPGFYFVKDDDWERRPERDEGKDVVITDCFLSLPAKGIEKYIVAGRLKKTALAAAAKRRKDHEEMGKDDGLTETDRRLRDFNRENDLCNLKFFKHRVRDGFKEYLQIG